MKPYKMNRRGCIAALCFTAMCLTTGCGSGREQRVECPAQLQGNYTAEAPAATNEETAHSEETAGPEKPAAALSLEIPKDTVIETAALYILPQGDMTPVAAYSAGLVPEIDFSGNTGNPVIRLPEGGRLVKLTVYRDDIIFSEGRFTEDGEIVLFPESTATADMMYPSDEYSIYEAVVELPEGKFSCLFAAAQDEECPPLVRTEIGGIWYTMTKGSWEWNTVTEIDGEEYITTTVACGEAFLSDSKNPTIPRWETGTENIAVIGLPRGAEITCAKWFDENNIAGTDLDVNGNTVVLPEPPDSKSYFVNISFPRGNCDYFFSVGNERSAGTE